MKKDELTKLRTRSISQLTKTVDDNKKKYGKIIAESKAAKKKDLKNVKKLRKDMAQILTIIKEKEIIQGLEKKVEEKK